MQLRTLALVAALGCGAKPNLAGDGGPGEPPSSASLSITPRQADVAIGAPTVFTVTNDGDSTTGAIGLEIIGTDSPSFSIGNSTCSVLVAHASCTVNVRLTPRATGTLAASLRASAGSTETMATLSASSNNALVIIPPIPGFVKTATDNDSPPAIYTVRNLGAATTRPLILSLDNIAPQFTFVHQMDLCTGVMLANGDDCTVAVAFSPRGTSIALDRSGMLSARDGNGAAAMIDLAATVGRLAFTTSTAGAFSGSACGAPPASTSFDFTNETWKPLTTFTYMLSGANANAFVLSSTCAPQPVPGTCTVTVSLAPTTSAQSTLTTTLTIKATEDMATSTQPLSVGASVTPCDLVVMPPSIAFPSTPAGTTGSGVTVTVTNNGSASHVISAVLGGASPMDFTILANQCGTVAPAGGNCTLQVAPKPLTAGGKAANLAITTPGLAPPPVTLTVDGAGGLVVTPGTPQLFAATGGQPVSDTFTVMNQGTVTTGMITTALSGAGAAAFAVGPSTCTTLAPGVSCTFQVTFAGNAPATATLSTHATPGGNANDVILTGTTM